MAECWQCNWWNFTENRFRLWTSRYSWSKSATPGSKRCARLSVYDCTSGGRGLTFFLICAREKKPTQRSTLTEFDDVSSLCVSVWSRKKKKAEGGFCWAATSSWRTWQADTGALLMWHLFGKNRLGGASSVLEKSKWPVVRMRNRPLALRQRGS